MASRCYSHGKQETDEEFDARWITYFSKPDIDAWELRKGRFICDGADPDQSSNGEIKVYTVHRSQPLSWFTVRKPFLQVLYIFNLMSTKLCQLRN